MTQQVEVPGRMTRRQLARVLEREGIRSDTYALYGTHEHDCYVLDHRAKGWVVFYSERGDEDTLGCFDTEDEACRHLLDLLRADDWVSARRSR